MGLPGAVVRRGIMPVGAKWASPSGRYVILMSPMSIDCWGAGRADIDVLLRGVR